MKWLKTLGAVALVLASLDFALIVSKRSLLVYVREYGPGEIIKTKRLGDIGGRDPAVVCTYWTGRAVWKFLDAPHRCVVLGRPTGLLVEV